jgi:dihydropteroate synthase
LGVCEIWGVLNVTPDSFSDGGAFLAPHLALTQARRMVDEGADVIDVGGESSRPPGSTYGAGAVSVPADEEARRVVPVVRALAEQGIRVSVDTVKADVARAALKAGAVVVNDVSCGRSEALLEAVSEGGAELVLMHTRGRGECSGENVLYADVVEEVREELLLALARAERCGVPRSRVWLDPGIGFAKTPVQSLALLARVDALVATGQRVLVGASRKSFIAQLAPDKSGAAPPPSRRAGGTAAAAAISALLGAHAIRVHDVAEMRQAALLGRLVAEVPR